MKMKRILATALAVMMAMSLAACGQKSEQSANSGSDTKSTTIHLWANGSDNVRQVFEAPGGSTLRRSRPTATPKPIRVIRWN